MEIWLRPFVESFTDPRGCGDACYHPPRSISLSFSCGVWHKLCLRRGWRPSLGILDPPLELYLICWRLYDSTECFSGLPQVMQKPGYSLASSKHYVMENPGFPRGGCQQQSKRHTLGIDLGPILERHHRLTLAA